MQNDNCDCGDDNCSDDKEVRVLPFGGGNAILCQNHYILQIEAWKERNKSLSQRDQYDLPEWEELKVYDTDKGSQPKD